MEIAAVVAVLLCGVGAFVIIKNRNKKNEQ